MTDCMRFLPDNSYSTDQDYSFKQGPINVMTYLTSRADPTLNATNVNDNDTMMGEGMKVFEQFTVDLMGAWSGISAAGLALACSVALFSF